MIIFDLLSEFFIRKSFNRKIYFCIYPFVEDVWHGDWICAWCLCKPTQCLQDLADFIFVSLFFNVKYLLKKHLTLRKCTHKYRFLPKFNKHYACRTSYSRSWPTNIFISDWILQAFERLLCSHIINWHYLLLFLPFLLLLLSSAYET